MSGFKNNHPPPHICTHKSHGQEMGHIVVLKAKQISPSIYGKTTTIIADYTIHNKPNHNYPYRPFTKQVMGFIKYNSNYNFFL